MKIQFIATTREEKDVTMPYYFSYDGAFYKVISEKAAIVVRPSIPQIGTVGMWLLSYEVGVGKEIISKEWDNAFLTVMNIMYEVAGWPVKKENPTKDRNSLETEHY